MAISDCASHHISDPLWHMRTSVHVYHAFPGARAYPRARARLCVWRLPLARLLIEPVTALYSTLLLALVVAVELLAAAGNGVYLPCLSPPSSQLRNKAKRALQHELQISALVRALLL